MKYICLDYGSKRIGISQSDDRGVLAFPYKIIENKNIQLSADYIFDIVKCLNIKTIVIGESLDKNNNPNPIHFAAVDFINKLQEKLNIYTKENNFNSIDIFWQKEWYSSVEARNTPKALTRSGNKKNIKKEDNYIDDKAATIILQNYLDKINNQKIVQS